jgi:hypothetical protein
MAWVLALLLLFSPAVSAEQAAPRVISDSPEYCAELMSRFAALGAQVSNQSRALAEEGRKLCLEGQSRSGIAKLRRALKEAQREE